MAEPLPASGFDPVFELQVLLVVIVFWLFLIKLSDRLQQGGAESGARALHKYKIYKYYSTQQT